MADSYITKKALANALKGLMNEIPFEKINVANICNECDMSRQSFYYHFKDKHDLVNWIYDTEFMAVISKKTSETVSEFWHTLCDYIYDNRNFYRKAFKIKGQNSFSDHFRERLFPIISGHLIVIFHEQNLDEFHITFFVNFFSDAFVCAIERWIQEKDCMSPEKFVGLLDLCIQTVSVKVYRDMNKR